MDELIINLNNIYLELIKFLDNISFYKDDFLLVKEEYSKIITNYVLLNKTLDLNHPLEYFFLFVYMLNNGYFSYGHHFTKTMDKALVYDISYHYELDVINGFANCRHIATLFKDILSRASIDSGLLLISISNYKYNSYNLTQKMVKLLSDLKSSSNSLEVRTLMAKINSLKMKIQKLEDDAALKGDNDLDIRAKFYNHLINIVNYKGIIYYLDPTINHTYTYNGESLECFYDKQIPIVFDVKEYQKFRDNQKQKNLKEWVLKSSSNNTRENLTKNIDEIIVSEKDLLEDFYYQNAQRYDFIVKKLQRYKK